MLTIFRQGPTTLHNFVLCGFLFFCYISFYFTSFYFFTVLSRYILYHTATFYARQDYHKVQQLSIKQAR